MAKRKAVEVVTPKANGDLAIIKIDPVKASFFTATEEAVRADGKAQHQWADVVAPLAMEVYGNLGTFRDSRAEVEQFGILPGLDDATRDVLNTKLPDARTKEGKAEGQKEKREARKAAQSRVSKIWARLEEYAFGAELKAERDAKRAEAGEGEGDGEGEEGDAGAVSLKTKTDSAIAALIKAHEKADNGNPDVIKALRAALEANAKTLDK